MSIASPALGADADRAGADWKFEGLFRGYAEYAVLTLPGAPGTP